MFGNDNDSLRAGRVHVGLEKASSFPSGEILARRRRSSELVTTGENNDQLKCNQASARIPFLSSRGHRMGGWPTNIWTNVVGEDTESIVL